MHPPILQCDLTCFLNKASLSLPEAVSSCLKDKNENTCRATLTQHHITKIVWSGEWVGGAKGRMETGQKKGGGMRIKNKRTAICGTAVGTEKIL